MPGDHQVEHADVDALAAAGGGAVDDGGQQPHQRPHCPADVGHLDAQRRRADLGAAAVAERARQGQVVDVVAGAVAQGAGLAIAGQGTIDDGRVDRSQRLVANAQPVHDARPELLDDDVVAGGHQPAHGGVGLRLFQVEGHGALVAVEDAMPGGGVTIEGRQKADHVRPRGRLDADDIRAQVGQDHRGVGAGQERGEVEDFEGAEWGHGH